MLIRHSLAGRSTSDSVILGLRLSDGRTAWGECLPRNYVTGEDSGATAARLQRAAPAWIGNALPTGREAFDAGPWSQFLAELDDVPSARCALESALLDGWGKQAEKPLIELLGPAKREELNYTGVIPADAAAVVAMVAHKTAANEMSQIKLKVGMSLEKDLENLALCRQAYDGPVDIRVDANCAWSVDEASQAIEALHEEGISSFEEPLQAGDIDGYVELQRRIPTDCHIIADESLCSLQDGQRLIEAGAVDGLNLKVSKLGGVLPTLKVVELARRAGVSCQLGAHIGESSLMSAAGLIVGALTGDLVAHEGAYGLRLLEYDLTPDPIAFGRCGALNVDVVSGGPGWAVTIDEEALAQATTTSVKIGQTDPACQTS